MSRTPSGRAAPAHTDPAPKLTAPTKRPFRLWNSGERRDEPHRYYATERRALDSALLLVRWAKVGTTFEVYDASVGRWLGTYKRGVSSISFTR